MKKELIEWRKPVVKVTTFEAIAEIIRAKARSGGTSCNICSTTSPCSITPTPCTGGVTGCSCATKCNPLAFTLSCDAFFIIVGSTGDQKQ